MYRPFLLICATAGLIYSPRAEAQDDVGVGWSISAAGSGWYLQRVSGAGQRLQVLCSPAAHGHWLYRLEVKSVQATSDRRNGQAEMLIERSPEVWRYQLALDGPDSASTSLGKSSFIALLKQLNSLTLGDVVSVPKLGFRIVPRNSDQETTFFEFLKLCSLDLLG